MKVIFIYVMLVFSISAILFLGGVTSPDTSITNSSVDNNNLTASSNIPTLYNDNAHFNAINLLIQATNHGLKSSLLWEAIAIFILAIIAAAVVNILTGGNASVGMVIGTGLFITFVVSVFNDFITLIHVVGQNCLLNAAGQCGDWVYWVIWLFGGLLAVGAVWSLFDYLGGDT